VAGRLRHSDIAVWALWVGAGLLGTLLPIIAFVIPLPLVNVNLSSFSDVYELTSILGGAATLALCQGIVLAMVIDRPSTVALMWIPVTVLATVAAYVSVMLWGMTVPRGVLSVSGIQDSLPSGFPLLQVIFALIGVAQAAFLGLAQGLLLATRIQGRKVLAVWFTANVLAAAVVGVVAGVRLQEPVPTDQLTVVAFLVSSSLSGGLFAAVTGFALAALVRRSDRAPRPAPA